MYLIPCLITLPLAIWRLSNMLSDTDQEGLFNSLDWIREKAGIKYNQYNKPEAMPGSIGAGMLCPYCSSIWFGVIFTIMLICSSQVTFFVSLPFALSTVAIFAERFNNADKT